jgi:hypothetical protein
MLSIIIIASLVIFGLDYTFVYSPIHKDYTLDSKGELVNPYGDEAVHKQINWWFRFYVGRFISLHAKFLKPFLKPLFGCVVCMSSVWGSLVYWLMQPLTLDSLITWIPAVCAIAGLNRIIQMITQR